MNKILIAIILILLVAVAVWYVAFSHRDVSVADILRNPRAYDDRTITIFGEVTERTSLFVVKYFTLDDGTGRIKVVSSRTLPAIGAKMRVRGRVMEAFSIGDTQMLVFVEDSGED